MRCPNCHHALDDIAPRISLEAAEADAKRWRDLYEIQVDGPREELKQLTEYVEWACGPNSGTSSLTILSAITAVDFCAGSPDVPHDVGDFGRCVGLLDEFHELREDLKAVPRVHPQWTRLVERWADLEALYRADRCIELQSAIESAIADEDDPLTGAHVAAPKVTST